MFGAEVPVKDHRQQCITQVTLKLVVLMDQFVGVDDTNPASCDSDSGKQKYALRGRHMVKPCCGD